MSFKISSNISNQFPESSELLNMIIIKNKDKEKELNILINQTHGKYLKS